MVIVRPVAVPVVVTVFMRVPVLLLMLFDVIRKLRGWDIEDAKKATKDKGDG